MAGKEQQQMARQLVLMAKTLGLEACFERNPQSGSCYVDVRKEKGRRRTRIRVADHPPHESYDGPSFLPDHAGFKGALRVIFEAIWETGCGEDERSGEETAEDMQYVQRTVCS